MYSLSNKQFASLGRGEKIKVALPPPDWAMGSLIAEATLLAWSKKQFRKDVCSLIVSAKLESIWIDCANPKGGLTEYYGGIIPDILNWSENAMRPIPTTVVAVELCPSHPVSEAKKLCWPMSWVSPLGYIYESAKGDW